MTILSAPTVPTVGKRAGMKVSERGGGSKAKKLSSGSSNINHTAQSVHFSKHIVVWLCKNKLI
jgi:hypothetical protein